MSQLRPHSIEIPPLLNGKGMLEYKRYQKSSKSSRTVREKTTQGNSKKVEVTNFGHPCAFHRESLDFYCHTHKEPACIICATTMHKVCHVVTVTATAVKSNQTCVNLTEVEQTMEAVIDNIEKIKYDREENLLKLNMQKHNIEKDLQNTRKKINERLDRFEKEVMHQLNDNYRRYKTEMDHLIKDLECRKQGVKSFQNAVIKARNADSDVEGFLEGKRIEKKIHQEEKYVCDFYNDEAIKQIDLEMKFNPLISSFLAEIKSFGEVIVRKSPSRVNLTRITHKHNLHNFPEGFQLTRNVSHIKVRLHEKTYNSTGIQDISTLPHIYNNSLKRQNTL